jgi:transcription elongation factor Elf1
MRENDDYNNDEYDFEILPYEYDYESRVSSRKTARRRASRKTAANWELAGLECSWYLYAEDGSKSYAVLDDIHERTSDTFGQQWAWSVYNEDFIEVAFGYADRMLDGQVDAERALSALTSTAKRKKAAYEISYQRFTCPHCNERVLDDDLIDEAKFTGKCPHCGGGIAFDDRHQPGQMDVRVARRKTARQVAVENLQEGDLVDLEGDPYADPNRANVRFENEFAEVDYVEINGGTVEVHFVDDWIGFPTGHTVEVAEDGYGAYYATRKTAGYDDTMRSNAMISPDECSHSDWYTVSDNPAPDEGMAPPEVYCVYCDKYLGNMRDPRFSSKRKTAGDLADSNCDHQWVVDDVMPRATYWGCRKCDGLFVARNGENPNTLYNTGSRKTAAPVKFPSKCKECGASIPVGSGDVRKVNGAWYTTCDAHKPAPKQRRSTDWYEDDDDPDHHSRGYGVPGGRRY